MHNYLEEELDEIQEKINYHFDNINLLRQAFTRSSYSTQFGGENNEILEFLGDKILDYFVIRKISARFGFIGKKGGEYSIIAHKKESDLTEIKKRIVSNEALSERINELGFASYMIMGDSDISNNVKNNQKAQGDLFEAIIGAVAIDSNWNQKLLLNTIDSMIEIDKILDEVNTDEETLENVTKENAITKLKEFAEHGGCSIPSYDYTPERVIINGEELWGCTCSVDSWSVSETAYALSKAEAKRNATYKTICAYKAKL